MTSRRTLVTVACLLVVHLLASLLLVVPGHISIDEGTYHLMAEAMSHGGFTIDNGYEAFPSDELAIYVPGHTVHVRPHDGHLVAQYPYLSSVLALPFYLLLGFRGLLLLNGLAFVATLLTTWALGRDLLGDRVAAGLGAAIFALGTFAWSYSLAAWPHMLHTALALLAFTLAVRALRRDGRQAQLLALAAGLVLGLDLGVRYDGLFVLGAIGLLQLFARPARLRQGALTLLGLSPGLALLAATNHAKFGSWAPLSYGNPSEPSILGRFGPLVMLGLLLLGARLLLRPGLADSLRRRWPTLALGLGIGLAALLALPFTRAPLWKLGYGVATLSIDLRLLDPHGLLEGFNTRGPTGGIFFMGGLKKALLQSCPWLPLVLLPALGWLRQRPGSSSFPVLITLPALLVVAYSYKSWHGGMCLNQRYLLPALPLLSLLAAQGLRTLPRAQGRWRWAVGLAAALPILLFLPTLGGLDPAGEEQLILVLPLGLAASLTAMLLCTRIPAASRHRLPPRLATLCALAALTWSLLVGFGYDLRLERRWRGQLLAVGQAVGEQLPDRALLLVDYHDPYYHLLASGQVRLAAPRFDQGADLPGLLAFHHLNGWPIYGALAEQNWQALDNAGLLQGHRVELVDRLGQVVLGRVEPDQR